MIISYLLNIYCIIIDFFFSSLLFLFDILEFELQRKKSVSFFFLISFSFFLNEIYPNIQE